MAMGQSDTDPSQVDAQGLPANSGNCQDPNSATCVPQSAPPVLNGSGSGFGSGYGQNTQGGAGLPNGGQQAPYGTGNQQLTQPNYRDAGALPDQARNRLPGYRPLPLSR